MFVNSGLVVFIFLKSVETFFFDNEKDMIFSLSQHLKSPYCILTGKVRDASAVSATKYLNERFVYTLFLEPAELIDYLMPEDWFTIGGNRGINVKPYASPTVIAWKTDTKSLMTQLEKVGGYSRIKQSPGIT